MKYTKRIADEIIALYSTGNQSVTDICKAVEIQPRTFYNWIKNNESFAARIEEAKISRLASIGDLAESALIMLIQKHEYEENHVEFIEGKDGKPKIKSQKKVKKVILPNPAMVALALTNCKPKDWKNKQSVDNTIIFEQPLFADDGEADQPKK